MPDNLASLAIGQEARITSLEGPASNYRSRLMSMGLLPGTRVKIVRAAPLGDPIEIRLRGYSLSLRRSEASIVNVEPCSIAR